MSHIFCRLEYYTQPVSCLPLYLIQCATGRLLITLLLSHGAHHSEILSVSWSYPLFPPWGSSPRNAKTSTNLVFPRDYKTRWHTTVYWKGSQELLSEEWEKTGKRTSKGYEQTLPLRSNLLGVSVILQNRFMLSQIKNKDIGVYLSSTCYHLHMMGYNFVGKSELSYVHFENPSLARSNHQEEMKAT